MKHLKSYKIFEKLSFDIDDIDDMFIELVESGYKYHVELDWYNGEDRYNIQSLQITIWKNGSVISFNDLESIREDIYRLVDFMKLKGYNITDTYPARLIKHTERASKKSIDKVFLRFSTRTI